VIALSGVDCAGKTTQRKLLRDALSTFGQRPVTVWTRAGYTPGLEAVKRAFNALRGKKKRARADVAERPSRYPRRAADLGNPLRRWLWLTSALLDLLVVYGIRIRCLRAMGRTVICDRYVLDCLVDFRVNFPDERIEERFLCRLLRRLCVRPDASFCLLIPAAETQARARRKRRFHRETLSVLEQRWRAYRSLSRELAVQVLDALEPPDVLASSIQRGIILGSLARELHVSGAR
jgi:thymidylate kinase